MKMRGNGYNAGLLLGIFVTSSSVLFAGTNSFRFAAINDKSLGLWEGARPVLVYNYGIVSKPGLPADRSRGTYIHPLYGLDGEVLTDDFPKDHYHHRGLFWAWPHVKIDGHEYDLWMLKGIEQRFERWLGHTATATNAVLGVENGWFIGERKVMAERVWLRVSSAATDAQALDCEFTWTPLDAPVTLAGAEGKSYGGLTLRFAPRTNTTITTPRGNSPEDLPMTRLSWADLTAHFSGTHRPSGAAIFIAPDHPDYPPEWLTRHYGVLCVGWPGVKAQTFRPGESIRCRYRIWIHRGAADVRTLEGAYRSYEAALAATEPFRSGPPQEVSAQLTANRVVVLVEDKLFTEYLFTPDSKYPYFFPVNGPRTGHSITTRRTEPYPHHSSLFFGCDRVNGGNYWQEGVERGQIISKGVRLTHDAGRHISFEQDARWERPGTEAPFDDHRRITISAPSPDLRCIDFEITLTARTKVRIDKTNHSLFSARMAPELSAGAGGRLVNANGGQAERDTFGRQAPWMDARGEHYGHTEGLAILCHPSNRWHPPNWFTRDYGFFSPTPMWWLEPGFVEFAPGEKLRLRYRVLVHAGSPSLDRLEMELKRWTAE